MNSESQINRQTMDVDIVCVGFGPAMGGFLTTLSRALTDANGGPALPSRAMEGMPAQVICYERADDISFGVSGVVTKGRSLRETFPDLNPAEIPMAAPVKKEKVFYLLDPHGVSRRGWNLKIADRLIRAFRWMLPYSRHAFQLPYIPPFMQKHGGYVLSMGQFMQWVGSGLMASGTVQIWPGMPVAEPLIQDKRVVGVRMADQGTDKSGKPGAAYMPGMDIRASLTVVGDGPVGAVGQILDRSFGMPKGHHKREWAVGMKMVVELPENSTLEPGTVFHTFGYPEPEIFGFMYVYPNRMASLGIFVPSWMDSPIRTSYRYLQHWMTHPVLWQYLEGAVMRSWGAKTLQESGRVGEPILTGDGYARIGEGSGSTNVLTGSGVDEAWATGIQLAEGVIEIMKAGKPFTRENLDAAYGSRRRKSWVEKEGLIAEKSRDGFTRGFVSGLLGMGMTGMTRGLLNMPGKSRRVHERIPSLESYVAGKISKEELGRIKSEVEKTGGVLHEVLMERLGWPKIVYDGKLLVSHQDALLMGGKVQAADGYADHVTFLNPELCKSCHEKICISICSAQAITAGEGGGVPQFDREKCVHCGACLWNCSKVNSEDPELTNVRFRAGSGGLHSAEN